MVCDACDCIFIVGLSSSVYLMPKVSHCRISIYFDSYTCRKSNKILHVFMQILSLIISTFVSWTCICKRKSVVWFDYPIIPIIFLPPIYFHLNRRLRNDPWETKCVTNNEHSRAKFFTTIFIITKQHGFHVKHTYPIDHYYDEAADESKHRNMATYSKSCATETSHASRHLFRSLVFHVIQTCTYSSYSLPAYLFPRGCPIVRALMFAIIQIFKVFFIS